MYGGLRNQVLIQNFSGGFFSRIQVEFKRILPKKKVAAAPEIKNSSFQELELGWCFHPRLTSAPPLAASEI